MSGYYPAGCTTKVFDEAWEDGYADYATVIYTCDKCGSEYEGELMIDSHHDGEEVEAEEPCDILNPEGVECGGTCTAVFEWDGDRGDGW
jgi:hypothetical protein